MNSDPFGLLGLAIERRYRVDEVVGEGGFGVVYKGVHLAFDAPIAIKCLKIPHQYTSEGQAAFVENFRREGALLRKLEHEPAIVRVYDFGVTGTPAGPDAPFLILEWLDGRTLERLLKDRAASGSGPFSEHEALAMVRPIAEAIAVAHTLSHPGGEGFAHRDLKPENLMQIKTRKGMAWKVLDFGIAKAMQAGETATMRITSTSSKVLAFTPQYGAPEQFSRKMYGPTGPWTDVHALGLILVELLTERCALDGDEFGSLLISAIAQVRPTARNRGATVSDACEALCMKALALMPEDRFPDAGAMVDAIDAILSAPRLVAGAVWREPITGMTFVFVPPGRFLMGASQTEGELGFDPEAHESETPAHEVDITQGFWMAEHPVTKVTFEAFLAARYRGSSSRCPVGSNVATEPANSVGFYEALAFAAWLTKRAGLGEGWRFDLPSEAEWEYAARGSDGRKYPWGDAPPTASLACFGLPSPTNALSFSLAQGNAGRPATVGGRPEGKSPFGCQDMAGNVWEWCLDAWRANYRDEGNKDGKRVNPSIDPCHVGGVGTWARVVRGGSWCDRTNDVRCTRRGSKEATDDTVWWLDFVDVGFRVVCRGPASMVGS